MSCGFFPALDKAGWREAPGWFEAVIPQPGSDSYINFFFKINGQFFDSLLKGLTPSAKTLVMRTHYPLAP